MAKEIEPQVFSIAEFCVRNRLTLPTFHKLQRTGRGPRMMRLGHVGRISLEAERAWREKMEADSNSEAALAEYQRRRKIMAARGRNGGKKNRGIARFQR